nr:PREDICTED: uncharacterized protein LOC102693602 isoform X2 [Lepisosteus oculatus]
MFFCLQCVLLWRIPESRQQVALTCACAGRRVRSQRAPEDAHPELPGPARGGAVQHRAAAGPPAGGPRHHGRQLQRRAGREHGQEQGAQAAGGGALPAGRGEDPPLPGVLEEVPAPVPPAPGLAEHRARRYQARPNRYVVPRTLTALLISAQLHVLKQKLQGQVSELCHRLGPLVTPLSVRLYSEGVLSLFELEQVQAAAAPFLQTQKLVALCLARGEAACRSFYQALRREDGFLAGDIDDCTSSVKSWEGGVNAIQPVSTMSDAHPPILATTSCALAVEETSPVEDMLQNLTLRTEYGKEIDLPAAEKDVISQVMGQLGLQLDAGMTLNVCELGVALGLPRKAARECLLELDSTGDLHQLAAVVHCFMEKTQDPSRLLAKAAACDTNRLRLSERGRLLLEMLQEAAAHLERGQQQQQQEEEQIQKCWHLFSFLAWDCLAVVEEDPPAVPWSGPLGAVERLKRDGLAEPELVQELEECWAEQTPASLRQSLCVLAQLLRDLHPRLDSAEFSARLEGEVYRCRPRGLHRLTRFKGLAPRVIYKVLQQRAPPAREDPAVLGDGAVVAAQYKEICLKIAQLLARVAKRGQGADLAQAPLSDIIQEIRSALSTPELAPDAFDGGLHFRLLSVVEFNPLVLGVPSLVTLHWHTLRVLEEYLRSSDRHSFQFVFEDVRMAGGWAELGGIRSVLGPIAIDNGVEEVFQFSTSEPASFLVRLHCRGYRGQEHFRRSEPRSFLISGLPDEATPELEREGAGVVLLAEPGKAWLRLRSPEGPKAGLHALAQRYSALLQEGSCCFLIKSSGRQCEHRD